MRLLKQMSSAYQHHWNDGYQTVYVSVKLACQIKVICGWDSGLVLAHIVIVRHTKVDVVPCLKTASCSHDYRRLLLQ